MVRGNRAVHHKAVTDRLASRPQREKFSSTLIIASPGITLETLPNISNTCLHPCHLLLLFLFFPSTLISTFLTSSTRQPPMSPSGEPKHVERDGGAALPSPHPCCYRAAPHKGSRLCLAAPTWGFRQRQLPAGVPQLGAAAHPQCSTPRVQRHN